MEVFYDDKNIIAAVKPPGIPSQPDTSGCADFMGILSAHCGHGLFLIHRLDRAVGGIMVYAKNKRSAAFLSSALQKGSFTKKYLAVVCGKASENGELHNWLIKNSRQNISKVVPRNTTGSKEAILTFKRLDTTFYSELELSLLEVSLLTGRHHQIRVQLANAGFPIFGDRKYNSRSVLSCVNIALFAYYLSIPNPESGEILDFASIPGDIFPFSLFAF